MSKENKKDIRSVLLLIILALVLVIAFINSGLPQFLSLI